MYVFGRNQRVDNTFQKTAAIVAGVAAVPRGKYTSRIFQCVGLRFSGGTLAMTACADSFDVSVEIDYVGDDAATYRCLITAADLATAAAIDPYGVTIDDKTVTFIGQGSRYVATRVDASDDICDAWSYEDLPVTRHADECYSLEFEGGLFGRALKECLAYADKATNYKTSTDHILISLDGDYVVMFATNGRRVVSWRLAKQQDAVTYHNGGNLFVVIPRKAAETLMRVVGKEPIFLHVYDGTAAFFVGDITINFVCNDFYPNSWRDITPRDAHVVCRVNQAVALTFLKRIARSKVNVELRDIDGACQCTLGNASAVIGSWNKVDDNADFCGARLDSKYFVDLLKEFKDADINVGINSFGRGHGSVVVFAHNDVVYRGVAATKVMLEEVEKC